MRKRYFSLILLFLTILEGKSQVYVFEGIDTTYLKQIEKFDNWSPEFWDWRDDLPKGSYYQISKHDCGVDTLREAHFSDSGVKDGIWINWLQSLCIAIDDESISTHTFSKTDALKNSETIYNEGFILKSTIYQLESELPLWENLYPPKTTDIGDWYISRIYKSGYLFSETLVQFDSVSYKKSTLETIFNKNGNKLYTDIAEPFNQKARGKLEFYSDNGLILALGEYAPDTDKKSAYTFNHYCFIGSWQIFDENGKHAATLKFKKGVLKKARILLEGFNQSIVSDWLNSLSKK